MNFLRNSRYYHLVNPTHFNFTFIYPISSYGYSLFLRKFGSIVSKSHLLINLINGSSSIVQSGIIRYGFDSCRNNFVNYNYNYNCDFRSYSTDFAVSNSNRSCNASRKNGGNLDDDKVSPGVIKNIIDVVKNDGSDMELNLDLMGLKMSKRSIIEVFSVLNILNVPALRFFGWVRNVYPRYSRNADLCSLAIDNCARLGDLTSFRRLLKEFRDREISLSDKAFGFLNISGASSEEAKKSVAEIVGVLNEVGGSCCTSGVFSLITMLCSLDLVDLAMYVVEITEEKTSYYNVLVKHMCVKGQVKEAREMLAEMSRMICVGNATAYNYLISSLCMQGRIDEAYSILNEMIDRGCLADELTFELLIYYSCRYGRSDDAVNLYNEMLHRGIKPRLPTHSAFIRGYVSARHFDEAYRYVVDAAAKDKWAASHMYDVLTSLHIEHGELLVAHKLLLEMFGKGFKPKLSVYQRASKRLYKTGMSELAVILNARYTSLMQESR